MRIFITGATGFAGSHLVKQLLAAGHEVHGLIRPNEEGKSWPFQPYTGDLLDAASLIAAMAAAKPDVIYHLAGQADVGLSWRQPARTLALNAGGTANLLEAVIAVGNPYPRIVAVTSGEIYGPLPPSAMPITDESRPNPSHPYAISKVAASQLLKLFHKRYGLEVIEARPFNHIGPHQQLGFVVPDFASQIAVIKLGLEPNLMRVGNLAAERDFTDVRDVVCAYQQLAEQGEPGAMYLICSGQPVAISYVLSLLAELAEVDLHIEVDPSRMRPSDTPVLYGSYATIERDTGWRPQISLRQSLADVLAEWLARRAQKELQPHGAG